MPGGQHAVRAPLPAAAAIAACAVALTSRGARVAGNTATWFGRRAAAVSPAAPGRAPTGPPRSLRANPAARPPRARPALQVAQDHRHPGISPVGGTARRPGAPTSRCRSSSRDCRPRYCPFLGPPPRRRCLRVERNAPGHAVQEVAYYGPAGQRRRPCATRTMNVAWKASSASASLPRMRRQTPSTIGPCRCTKSAKRTRRAAQELLEQLPVSPAAGVVAAHRP